MNPADNGALPSGWPAVEWLGLVNCDFSAWRGLALRSRQECSPAEACSAAMLLHDGHEYVMVFAPAVRAVSNMRISQPSRDDANYALKQR